MNIFERVLETYSEGIVTRKWSFWGDFYYLLLLSFFVNELDLWMNAFFFQWTISPVTFTVGKDSPCLIVVSNIPSWEAHFFQRHRTLSTDLRVHFSAVAQNFLRLSVCQFFLLCAWIFLHLRSSQIVQRGHSTRPRACCAQLDYVINGFFCWFVKSVFDKG